MSQTPLPTTMSALPSSEPSSLAEEPRASLHDETATTGEFRARKRTPSTSNRPVSAFAPGQNGRGSDPPPGRKSTPPSPEELAFASALRAAGVAQELDETELGRSLQLAAHANSRAGRRIDLLAAYYAADHDPLAAKRRQATDRWYLHHAADPVDAATLLARLLDLVPELTGAELERLGGPDGPLVLRHSEDICALEDEREDAPGLTTLSVCDLVRAINVLLERRTVRARLVGLLGDGQREAYLALPSVTAAITLSNADYLSAADAETLLDLTGW
ncbi:MAG TPA: hypothetical protein VFX59_07165 [Polyangiales bacterium]|nr:hypothetical protein [Polyangiales bacterium]